MEKKKNEKILNAVDKAVYINIHSLSKARQEDILQIVRHWVEENEGSRVSAANDICDYLMLQKRGNRQAIARRLDDLYYPENT